MELRDILLGGGFAWLGEPPSAIEAIQQLIAWSPVPLPASYLDFLRLSDGGHADMSGYPSYVRIWSARTVIQYNEGYEVKEFLPDFLGIGDNGGPDMLGFDLRAGQPYPMKAIPFTPMEWEAAIDVASDFDSFVLQILPKQSNDPGN